MLDYLVLKNKRTVTREGSNNNELQYDMLNKVINTVDFNPQDIIIVNKYYIARPDLISLACYGDDKYADIICKYNGISNPFEINEDDIIYIPPLNALNLMFNSNIVASNFIDKQSNSNNIIEKEYPLQKDINERRSPAEQVVGEQNYVIDKSLGVVFY